MNPREQGFLLLTSRMGDPERKPLTAAQLRALASRVSGAAFPREDRELEPRDLMKLGYGRDMAERICGLLSDTVLLTHYLRRGRAAGCIPISRVSENYPPLLRQRLGLDSPGCIWAKGDVSLLNKPAIALVGSRDLEEPNRIFAREVGLRAARSGVALVSGNARGADRTAQDACLEAGGSVICFVADDLEHHPVTPNVLYLSEDAFDAAFTSIRALSRNRCIHALGQIVFVAQAALGKGGTWDGTTKNLRHGWSSVAVFRDGSEASRELEQLGAYLVDMEDLKEFSTIPLQDPSLF